MMQIYSLPTMYNTLFSTSLSINQTSISVWNKDGSKFCISPHVACAIAQSCGKKARALASFLTPNPSDPHYYHHGLNSKHAFYTDTYIIQFHFDIKIISCKQAWLVSTLFSHNILLIVFRCIHDILWSILYLRLTRYYLKYK